MSKKVSNRLGGRRAKKLGDMFEHLIERSCNYYRNKGIAHIQKTPEPFRFLGKRGKHVYGFYEKQAQPDFQGTLENGQSIIFEAKHTDTTNLPFERITRAQTHELERHNRLGAECYVIVSFSFKHFYLIDWKDWKNLKETVRKKSVNQKDLEAYEIQLENGILNFLKK